MGSFRMPNVLEYRAYFVPKFIGESESCLFLWMVCATDRQAILALSKSGSSAIEYDHIVGWDIPTGRVLWVPVETRKNDFAPYALALSYCDMRKDTIIRFQGISTSVLKSSVIDSFSFDPHSLYIEAYLRPSPDTIEPRAEMVRVGTR